MTTPMPAPPIVDRMRLRARWARRRAALALAAELRRVVALLDPPPEVTLRAMTADGIRRAETADRYRSTVSDRPTLTVLRGPAADLARVNTVAHKGDDAPWVECSLGVLTATRPIGSLVLVEPREGPHRGLRLVGRIVALDASVLSLVRYVITIDLVDGGDGLPDRLSLDLPLSHPVEVCHA